ncbi:uncharacterized protein PHALS_12625 [Plasmopara halstedii]|uniref:Uncharacterized protein n=1 Tax=Plasmopara halstedii TaxID=4781 RepID=A0A0P1ALQ0_PLAHL|nr:uncharacterized protein PHALS_12625 [Plasmopara halstedii]CEG42346.1 hypothetical protein PHALS_12625 [Plasmopara halstedii]|eukprot:XP_024578715.1 hypothetical protein PHALS_12625 [Plasmopara halstedii]
MKTQCQKERQMRLSKIDHSGILYRKIISLSNPLLQTYSKKLTPLFCLLFASSDCPL